MKQLGALLPKDATKARVDELRKQQDALRQERKKLNRAVRNEERKKTRLRRKAKQLTDEDLINIMVMRKATREAREGAAARRAEADTGMHEASASAVREPSPLAASDPATPLGADEGCMADALPGDAST